MKWGGLNNQVQPCDVCNIGKSNLDATDLRGNSALT